MPIVGGDDTIEPVQPLFPAPPLTLRGGEFGDSLSRGMSLAVMPLPSPVLVPASLAVPLGPPPVLPPGIAW